MVDPSMNGSVGAATVASAMSACSSRTSEHREFRIGLPSSRHLLQFLRREFLLGRSLVLTVQGFHLFQY